MHGEEGYASGITGGHSASSKLGSYESATRISYVSTTIGSELGN